MVKIGIIGATGMAGSVIFKEAAKRGHEVTALVRNAEKAQNQLGEEVNCIEKDVFDLTKEELAGFDVIVNAFGTKPERGYLHVDLAAKLVAQFRETEKPRLFFILGAGSLLDEKGHLFVETLRKAPESETFIGVPEGQLKELNFLNEVDNVNWVGVSPGAEFADGDAKTPVYGNDHLLRDSEGNSHTSTGTMAKVILDEIEENNYHQERFTAIDE